MGKSAAKWIKAKLFGRKASRSAAVKLANDKHVRVIEHCEKNESAVEHSSVLHPSAAGANVRGNVNSDGGGQLAYLSAVADAPKPVVQAGASELKEMQAATKVQAALRGYLARRAFQALRGIIRLQAMIRGHLVRRQAIATLQCLQGIVKLQAIARGARVRSSDIGLAVRKVINQVNPMDTKIKRSSTISGSVGVNRRPKNAFVQQLFAQIPATSVLRFHYNGNEPNSAVNWLERWMLVSMWEPSPLINKSRSESSLQLNQSNGHHSIDPTEYNRTKGNTRRITSGNVNLLSSGNTILDDEMPRRNLKKLSSSHAEDQVQEHQLSELEKVKRSLRKVSASMANTTPPMSEVLPEVLHKSPADVPKQTMEQHAGNQKNDPVATNVTTAAILNENPEIVATNVTTAAILDENPETVKFSSLEENAEAAVDDASLIDGYMHGKERQVSHENQKNEKKRPLLPSKLDENGVSVTPTLPRYMAATESAKAKLGVQNSPGSVSDIPDKNAITRRHSLPAAPNGKVSSPSLKAERQSPINGKTAGKNSRTLQLTRDGNEKIFPDWRR